MGIINVHDLKKHFKVLNRKEGLMGAIKDLFSKDYRIIKAVDGISMEIEEGEIVGFAGPNGAGKSTTIKMLSGVLEPSDGKILINDYTPYKQRKQYIKNVGIVFGQRTQLWWDIPVIESFKLLKEIYEISDEDYKKNLGLFDELIGIKKLFLTPVRNLSLGQRMLCDITASFLHNPKIIFLDEPTIGLDVSIKKKIRKIVKDLNQIKKSTILLTTHDMGDIEKLCERIIIIDKGKLIYDGDIEKFNTIFGSFRTLNIKLDSSVDQTFIEYIRSKMFEKNILTKSVSIEKKNDDWLSLTINQDEIQLMDVLNFFIGNHDVKDIKVEEMGLENVIQKVYEGEIAGNNEAKELLLKGGVS